MSWMVVVAVAPLLLVLTGITAGDSVPAYDEIVARARRCPALEPCAIAGGVKGCRCPVAVRADAREAVSAAAQETRCAQTERLYCPRLEHPRCEKQVCVADQVRE